MVVITKSCHCFSPLSRDATWEENNAFADLLIQYDRCDNKSCLCPDGVTHISEEEDT